MTERIRLSDHFTYKKLFQFVLPSIVMMVFISIYGIVDGFFVSNFAGEMPFAALNLIYPFIMILGAVGFMLGTGGNAAVSKLLGEGDGKMANRVFSMLIYATLIIGGVLALIGILFVRPIAELLASAEKNLSESERAQLIEYCVIYARIILSALPMFMIQNAFQGFFVTAEKPRLGLYVTIGAGVTNILLDLLFVAGFQGGLVGAAIATALSQCIGGALPLFYFFRKNDSLLRLGKTKFQGKIFLDICINGMSELMTNISMSVVTILFNMQLMRYIGIQGVSAYGIMMYIGFIFIAVFIGYSIGSAPIIGYHFGAENQTELKNILRKSAISLTIAGVVMTLLCVMFAKPLSRIFVPDDRELLQLTIEGLRLYSLGFLLSGLNIFASSFFTALSNGVISLVISFFRTFLFQVVAVLLLPLIWGVNGIWLASVVAELFTLFLSVWLIYWKRKKYGYL
ncbi:MAG: MATE family efflux transporter [Clostridia bacterium]|nr:MATE family efflux transporter [Clostridia bacterium]